MNPTKSISASFFPAVAWPTRVLHTDTNSARRPVAAGVFSGAVLSAGRDISGERSNDRALPSRTAIGRFFFRLRNAGVASGLASGKSLNCAADDVAVQPAAGFNVVISPARQPARFFFCPRRNHSSNSRGLRLAWLLGIDELCRRRSAADDTGLQ